MIIQLKIDLNEESYGGGEFVCAGLFPARNGQFTFPRVAAMEGEIPLLFSPAFLHICRTTTTTTTAAPHSFRPQKSQTSSSSFIMSI